MIPESKSFGTINLSIIFSSCNSKKKKSRVQFQSEFHEEFKLKKSILLPVNFQKSPIRDQKFSILKLIKKILLPKQNCSKESLMIP